MNNSPANVLLIDDDVELCQLIAEFLRNDGFTVDYVNHGRDGLETLSDNNHCDIVVLDIMMPDISGMEVLQTLRKTSEIPVIMLTGRGDDIDRIVGLEMGADDYLGKPCNPRELAARIRSVLRRYKHGQEESLNTAIGAHGVELYPGERKLEVKGKKVDVTSVEFDVLRALMEQAGSIVTRETLTEKVLHRKLTTYDRSIDVHISRIRQKLNAAAELGHIIKSVRGTGYQLISDANTRV